MERGNTTFIQSFGCLQKSMLICAKETSKTKSPPSDTWEGRRETASSFGHSCIPEARCDNGQIEKLKYLGFSSPNFKVGTH